MLTFSLQVDPNKFSSYLNLAKIHQLGVDLTHFTFPHFAKNKYLNEIKTLKRQLENFPYPVTMHGFFHELYPFSPDEEIIKVCEKRMLLNLKIAKKMNIKMIVFHHNFLPNLSTADYQIKILQNNIKFWKKIVAQAAKEKIIIAVENVWDQTPDLLKKLIQAIPSPYFKICFDVAHRELYSSCSLQKWLKNIGKYIVMVHLHNNNGREDEHQGLEMGVINMKQSLQEIKKMKKNILVCLEIWGGMNQIKDSIQWLKNEKIL